MKKIIAILVTSVALAGQTAAAADGTIVFNTANGFNTNPALDNFGGPLSGNFSGQLYFGASAGSLAAFGTVQSFGTLLAGQIFSVPSDQIQSGLAPGTTGVYEVRAWEAPFASYEAAVAGGGLYGNSFDHVVSGATAIRPSIILGGNTFLPQTANQHGSFALVPEPTTMVLGLMGLGSLVAARRRQK
jgi:hypothetical protein